MFVHHVLFWLKDDMSKTDIQNFEEALQSLLKIEYVKYGDIGKPAAATKPVIDSSYSYSLLTVFDNQEGHDLYQPHPVHKNFLEQFSPFYKKVLVYDSETI
jgi:hypothetical protein